MAGFVCSDLTDASPTTAVAVVLSDSESALADSAAASARIGQGLVVIGAVERSLAADAYLPPEPLDREVVVACQLVVEIARLRRQRHSDALRGSALAHLALTDPLTGLGNRRAWELALQRVWADLVATPRNVCLGIFDLDLFKTLNDTRGHAAGDEALRIAGKSLAATIRKDDFAARLGGDEFGVVWVGLDVDAAPAVVERVRAQLSEQLAAGIDARITASAGYACADSSTPVAADVLLARADMGLQAAKRCGRGRTRVLGQSDPPREPRAAIAGDGRRIDAAAPAAGEASNAAAPNAAALFAQAPSRVE
jgi:diguanylate cyclase (GGDEF)-like protein